MDERPIVDERRDASRTGAVTGGRPDAPRTGAVTSPVDLPAPVPAAARFGDRRDAGRRLAALLVEHPLVSDRGEPPVVLAIPRGGVPVGAEVAGALEAPLDVAVVRKVGAPGNPEFAIGALAEGGVRILSDDAVHALGISQPVLQELLDRGERELLARLLRYRGEREPVPLGGRTAILVDDGLATGSSALAAVESLRRRGAARVVLAVPVAASQAVRLLGEHADEVVCVEVPANLWAVGYWYRDFRPTRDEEVTALLAAAPADRFGDPTAP